MAEKGSLVTTRKQQAEKVECVKVLVIVLQTMLIYSFAMPAAKGLRAFYFSKYCIVE